MIKHKTKLTLDDLTKNNIWTVTSSELSQMIINAKKKREDFVENEKHYMNIIKAVFDIQYLKKEDDDIVKNLERTGYEIFSTTEENGNNAIAIRKHPIKKVTDLTLENIQHLEAWEVLDLIAHNMGTGWKGLPLAIQDIIESAFFVDCTVMPIKTMKKKGGIIDKRKEDGYEVLEIERGTWLEGIFMKMKPKVEKVHINYSIDDEEESRKKHKKNAGNEEEEIYDEDIELEEDDEDLNDDELKMLDGGDDDELDDEEVDESNIQLEDIDVIDDMSDEDDDA
ncbi:MAG: hypothetical protein J1F40_02605 [Prevotellaceae bacterium]|nr:hypothetical protein [Prevotellaceae bacterium]